MTKVVKYVGIWMDVYVIIYLLPQSVYNRPSLNPDKQSNLEASGKVREQSEHRTTLSQQNKIKKYKFSSTNILTKIF